MASHSGEARFQLRFKCLLSSTGFSKNFITAAFTGLPLRSQRGNMSRDGTRFPRGTSATRRIKSWEKCRERENLSDFPCAPPLSPRCSRLLHWGSDHEVSAVLIRWNKASCNPHSDQRHWSACHAPLPLSSCANLSEGKLTDPATRGGGGGGRTEERTERLSVESRLNLLDLCQRIIACCHRDVGRSVQERRERMKG